MVKQILSRNAIQSCFMALFLIAGAFSGGVIAQTSKPEEIRYAYLDQSIFHYTANEWGEQIDGPLLRLAAAVFGKAGIPWRGDPFPAARLFQNMKNGTSNFTILVRAPTLDDCCIFSKKSVIGANLRVYRIGNTPPITNKDQLRGKNLITIAGYSYAGMINFLKDPMNAINIEVADSHRAGFAMLKAGRGDYFLDYDGASEQALIGNPVPNLQFDVIDRINLHFILSKAYPDAATVMARLEAIHSTIDMDAILKIR